jgi:hypothetical protein
MNLFIIFDSLLKNCGSSSGVEHQLPKLRVAGSRPVSRSQIIKELEQSNSFFLDPYAHYLHTVLSYRRVIYFLSIGRHKKYLFTKYS